jgi:putative transposase
MQNGHVESFNGKFRDECLNEHWFSTLAEARAIVTSWRRDYNENPHSSIDYLAPSDTVRCIAPSYAMHRKTRNP